jgi:hypothetical protein
MATWGTNQIRNSSLTQAFLCDRNPYGTGPTKEPTTPEDTLVVYNETLKNPNVDPHLIYPAGQSAGTATIVVLLADHPDLWRGAIMI